MEMNSERFDGEYPDHERAKKLGWINKSDQNRRSWEKGTLHIWQVGTSYPRIHIWWVAADLLDGRYQNHRTHASFNEAIKLEEGDRRIIDESVRLSREETYYPRHPPKHVINFIDQMELPND